jgi:hypothetical protein
MLYKQEGVTVEWFENKDLKDFGVYRKAIADSPCSPVLQRIPHHYMILTDCTQRTSPAYREVHSLKLFEVICTL